MSIDPTIVLALTLASLPSEGGTRGQPLPHPSGVRTRKAHKRLKAYRKRGRKGRKK